MTSTTLDQQPFDVTGPLPQGVTVLEASAGTGKTYAIAALAARYVANGIPLDKLLLVTFTRMATGELRDRVRERLVSTEHALERALAGDHEQGLDAVVDLLAEGSPEEVEQRRDHLARAIADFDAATIATTHGFCQEVLSGLGIAGDIEPDTTLVEDADDLLKEVVNDLYIRRWHHRDKPVFNLEQAMKTARIAVENPAAPIEPQTAPRDETMMRVRFAKVVRDEFDTRKRRTGVMTYDDLLTRLDRTLAGPGGPAAAKRLRERYHVVLVDEFQDTDPVQWDIMRRAFGTGESTLVLIGDPKQAIYAFRGADVYAYIEAANAATTKATLRRNWRSDEDLIKAYGALFGNARLGHSGIQYLDVDAAPANVKSRLIGAPEPAPMRIRLASRDEPSIGTTFRGYAQTTPAREYIADDLAYDMVELLESGAEIETRSGDGTPTGRTKLRPGHIAVLVRTHRNAAMVRDALERVGVPAVINGAGSVFGTPPARDWLRLLEAIERPSHPIRARSAALTPFFGKSARDIAEAGDEEWERVHRRLHHWARVLRLRGVASLIETINIVEGLPARVLSTPDGERRLTDLRHIGQLLHAAVATEGLGIAALTTWLRTRIEEAERDTGDEERSRRLESDAEAVQVLTIHRSKGLEFPVVYYPYLWDVRWKPDEPEPVFFHDPDNGDKRTIDVGVDGPQFRGHQQQNEVEDRGEELRLAYVALTRAQHQAVVWWAGTAGSRDSSLTRLLFNRDEEGNVAARGGRTPLDPDARTRLDALAAAAPGCISIEQGRPRRRGHWVSSDQKRTDLAAAEFDRLLDWGWRRTSYTDMTADAYESRVASEPEEVVVTDEPPPDALPSAAAPTRAVEPDPAWAAASLWADMPVGVNVGTFVHRVLEATDFAAGDLDAELGQIVAAEQARRQADIGERAAAVAAIKASIETPLGPLVNNLTLRHLTRENRLDELDFELPIAGGDRPTGVLTPRTIADVLRSHGDPIPGYAERLADPGLRGSVRGYLTGSIDLVMRLPDGRFAIADYKTNWLAAPGEALTIAHHRPVTLAHEMQRSHYALQALLYSVALHRYLRWRLAGYDPDQHFAGVLYLFTRGMCGPGTPTTDGIPAGVFSWRPPSGLVPDLSDALA